MLGSRFNDGRHSTWSPKKRKSRSSSPVSNRHLTALFEEQGLEWTDELIIHEKSWKGTKCQPDQWTNGEFVCLKEAIGQHLVDIHGQHDQEKNSCGPSSYRRAGWIWGCSLFPNQRRLSSDFEDYKRLRKQVGGTPAQPTGKQGPYWDVGVQIAELRRLPWKSGWGPASGARTITPAQSTRWLLTPNQRLCHAGCRRVFSRPLQCSLNHEWFGKVSKNMIPATRALKPVIWYLIPLRDITKRLEDVVDGLEFDGNPLMQVELRLDLIPLHQAQNYGGQSRTYWNTWRKSPRI